MRPFFGPALAIRELFECPVLVEEYEELEETWRRVGGHEY
jgi:hypothetical protein